MSNNNGNNYLSVARFQSLAGSRQRHQIQEQNVQKLIKSRISPYKRFQNYARSVRIIVAVCIAVRKEVSGKSGGLSLAEFQTDIESSFSESLAFHPLYIVKKQEPKGSEELKKLLSIPAAKRTEAVLEEILVHVRRLKSFTTYSNTLQRQLCQVLRYESYGKRRVIVQQGDRPIAYYFIVSGTLLVNITAHDIRTNKQFTRTVQEIGEGKSFGEVALINGSRRTATIVSKAFVELLAIDKEDFQKTILQTFLQEKKANLDFLRKMRLFELWPVDILFNRSDAFFYHHYRPGTVIVQNSRDSRWITIIKEGKCKVVCKIKRPIFDDSPIQIKIDKPKYSTFLPTLRILPQEATRAMLRTNDIDRPKSSDDGQENTENKPEEKEEYLKDDALTMFKQYGHSEQEATRRKKYLDVLQKMGNSHVSRFRQRANSDPTARPRKRRTKSEADKEKIERIKNKDMTSNIVRIPSQYENRSNGEMFVQVATLRNGEIFGLQNMVDEEATNCALISEGSEVIFVSKQLFLKEANKSVLTILGNLTTLFPSERSLQKELQEQRSWSNFKRVLVDKVVDYTKEEKEAICYSHSIMHS